MVTALDNLARKQIYIPANQPETVQLRVAAYCRVSTDSEDQLNSFAAQNTHYSQMIRNHDLWELVDIYADAGITGTSAAKRGDFQRMLADCRKGKIDKILVKSISRFARNSMECLETIRELKALGISVFFEEHNIDTKMVSSEMLTAVIAACAQAESESISKNMRWSYQKRMVSGEFITCKAPFGYRLINNNLVIEPREAAIVQEIYNLFLSGWSTTEIANKIIKDGIQLQEGAERWGVRAVQYILQNEKYIGDSLLQKRYSTESFPRERKYNHGEQPMYYVENTHSPIIDRTTFERVQTLYRSKRPQLLGKPKQNHLFRQKIICKGCGSYFRKTISAGKHYWACGYHNKGGSCPTLPVPEEEIFAAFCRLYFKLKHHTAVLDVLTKNLTSTRNRQMLWSPAVMELNKEISDILSQSHALSLLKKQGAVDSDVFISMSNQLAEQLRSAKQRKEQLQKRDDDETITQTQNLIETLDAGPEFLDSFDEELFCELIDKIIIDSNTKIRFRLKNGLELPESIERTVR